MSASGVYLLFTPEKRPPYDAVKNFVTAKQNVGISHTPDGVAGTSAANKDNHFAWPGNETDDIVWVELLREGLTFDLLGLAPGPAMNPPKIRNSFDFRDADNISDFEALLLMPGPHLAGGEYSLPVVRGLMALTCELLQSFGEIAGVIWPPSFSVIGRRYFESTISAWLEGGPFPSLGLTAFENIAGDALQSVGLSYFIDREIRIEPPLSNDKVLATRLGVRLVNQLVLLGGIEGEERLVAPDGSRLVLRDSNDERLIKVRAD